MKFPVFIRSSAVCLAVTVFASIVQAHPGHDGEHGGGLVWDFKGVVVHYLTSPAHVLPVAVLGGLGWLWLRHRRAQRGLGERR